MATLRAAAFLDKGGVGKTTATAHFGRCAADMGYDVLLIDLAGKQNDLAKHFGLFDELPPAEDMFPHVGKVFSDDWDALVETLPDAVDRLIHETDEGVDLIPAHESLDKIDNDLASVPIEDRVTRLDAFLTEYIDGRYDVVLLDLPGLTNNVTHNGLVAAEHVFAPAEMGPFEEKQLNALKKDLKTIREKLGTSVELSMVIPNRVDTRTKVGAELLKEMNNDHKEVIAPVPVPESQDFKNAQNAGRTLFALEEPLKTGERARDAYQENTEALLNRLNGVNA